ncbi:MAG: hypothetical protein ACREIA_15255 [Opitutaceae bacterium]
MKTTIRPRRPTGGELYPLSDGDIERLVELILDRERLSTHDLMRCHDEVRLQLWLTRIQDAAFTSNRKKGTAPRASPAIRTRLRQQRK